MKVDIIAQMKEVLVPQGEQQVVRLFLNPTAYFTFDFVKKCIGELETKMVINESLGIKASPLEILAFHVLKDSAYIGELTNESKGTN